MAALSILPTDLTVRKKLRATLQMQLARYYLERLCIGSTLQTDGKKLDMSVVKKKFVDFPPLQSGESPKIKTFEAIAEGIKNFQDVEDAKLLVRLANTQFKRALEYFKLDGHVTEHIQIKQDVSKLYKQLSQLEPEKDRFIAMQERRKELLEPLMTELNHKAYEVNVIELGVELQDIYGATFDVIYEDL